MSIDEKLLTDLIYKDLNKSLPCFLERYDFLITHEIGVEWVNADSFDLVDKDFLKEVKDFCPTGALLSFGTTLRDIKCVISDDYREHVIWLRYSAPKNLCIRDMNLPQSYIPDQNYKSIEEVVNIIKKHVDELSNYFVELEQIDECCTIMEPVRPTYRENYRKIYLADKIWLHVEVSPDGAAKNLRVVGQFDQGELQELLQDWDHNKDIVTNVLKVKSSLNCDRFLETYKEVAVPACGICYCVELPGVPTVPQPLCNNSKCGAYYHASCLYEWLVICAGGRKPQFGVGKCPSCSQYIQCNESHV